MCTVWYGFWDGGTISSFFFQDANEGVITVRGEGNKEMSICSFVFSTGWID